MREELVGRICGKRAVILGVGNPMRGDDGVGPALVDMLQGRVDAVLIDGGEVPENFLNSLRAAQPQVVMIVNAIEMGIGPGGVALLELEHLFSPGRAGYCPGLAILGRLIHEITTADVFVLGVQPDSSIPDTSLSSPVAQSVQNIGDLLQTLI
ncbi:MAG: hydrogenase maturation protease [Anaerolineales bacterium]|nr:hydrogenase maturation protease [Anaerolineales bacterium]